MHNKFSPALVCGFGAAVLMTLPGFKSFSCCLIVPFAAGLSLYFDLRINGFQVLKPSKGAVFGLLTGIFAGTFGSFLDILMTYFLHTNDFVFALPELEKTLRDMKMPVPVDESIGIFKKMGRDIQQYGFSTLYTSITFISNLFTDSLFGVIGGLIGVSYLNKKNSENNEIDS